MDQPEITINEEEEGVSIYIGGHLLGFTTNENLSDESKKEIAKFYEENITTEIDTLKDSLDEANKEIQELKSDINSLQDSECDSCTNKSNEIHQLEEDIEAHYKYSDLPELHSLGDENKFEQVMKLYPHFSQIFLDATENAFKQVGYL